MVSLEQPLERYRHGPTNCRWSRCAGSVQTTLRQTTTCRGRLSSGTTGSVSRDGRSADMWSVWRALTGAVSALRGSLSASPVLGLGAKRGAFDDETSTRIA